MSILHGQIKQECDRIEEDSIHSSKGHYSASTLWHVVHYLVGLPATLVTAIAGLDAFSDNPTYAGYLALIGAVMMALQTFIQPSDKLSQHKASADEYLQLRNQSRVFRTIKLALEGQQDSDLVSQLEQLTKTRDKLNRTSPKIPYLAFKLAKRGIDNGENKYRTDGE